MYTHPPIHTQTHTHKPFSKEMVGRNGIVEHSRNHTHAQWHRQLWCHQAFPASEMPRFLRPTAGSPHGMGGVRAWSQMGSWVSKCKKMRLEVLQGMLLRWWAQSWPRTELISIVSEYSWEHLNLLETICSKRLSGWLNLGISSLVGMHISLICACA